jgi:hypothetical protein
MTRWYTVYFSAALFMLITFGVAQCRDNVTNDMLNEGWMAWDMDGNGLIHIVWNNESASGRNYLYYCNYNPDTGVTSPHVKVGYSGGH